MTAPAFSHAVSGVEKATESRPPEGSPVRGLSGFGLKRIAIISMLIDHFGSIILNGVLAPYYSNGALTLTSDMPFLIRYAPLLKDICEALGRVAFPIFCFLLVEGFRHTRSRVRYGVRMGLFALASEVPFDLAHSGQAFDFGLQNVMFTLCIGIFTLLAMRAVAERFAGRRGMRVLLTGLVIAAGMGLAYLIRSEYVFLGVLTIALIDLLHSRGPWRAAALAPLLIVSPWVLLSLVPLSLYNGQRGRGAQYFFYWFYPAHFLLFAGIATLLANRPV